MKSVIYGSVLLSALLGEMIATHHLPKAGMELWTFRKVSDADLDVMRGDAIRFVPRAVVQDVGRWEKRHFELSCHGRPVLLADNSLEQLVIVLLTSSDTEIPCVAPLLLHCSTWPAPD